MSGMGVETGRRRGSLLTANHLVLPTVANRRKHGTPGQQRSPNWSRQLLKGREDESAHLDGFIPTSTDDLVGDPVDAVDLVRVAGQVRLDLVGLEVPDLQAGETESFVRVENVSEDGRRFGREVRTEGTLRVESLLALMTILESELQLSR